MKLKTKVLLSFSVILSISLSLFGVFTIFSVERDALNVLSTKLDAAVIEINSLVESPITAAFSVSANSDFELLVGLYDTNRELLSFTETEIEVKDITLQKIENAQIVPVKVEGAKTYLIRTISMGNNSYVVLASGIEPIEKSISELRSRIIFAILFIQFAGLLLIYGLIRKDLVAINNLSFEADRISNGEYHFAISLASGDAEVAVLSRSISSMAQTLQNQNSKMQQLLGDISHELKTPLTSIKGYTEILSHKPNMKDDDLRVFEILQNEIDHMTRLIDDLLLMSKLGAVSYELTDEVNLGKLVAERFSKLKELQPDREITIINECKQNIKTSLPLITRLVDNLISNALAHTLSTDSISIALFIEDGSWSLQYEDSGKGLPEVYFSAQDFDFIRFDSRRSEGKGTGLGLSIIQQIIRQHDGKLVIGKSYLGGLLLRVTAPVRVPTTNNY